MNPKTLSLLEYDKILARLTEHCAFSASAELAENLNPTPSFKKAKIRLEETTEARLLFSTHETISVGGARDVREAVKLASRGGVLETQNLLDIKNTLIAARRLKKTFSNTEIEKSSGETETHLYPHLAKIIAKLPSPLGLVSAITNTISEKGEILDSASTELASIRRERRVSHDRLMTKLQKIISNSNNLKVLQEAIITQRDGRYVIPLQSQFKGRIKGIIHDQSSSGATIFIEPLSTVESNNKLRELQLAERDEERRVLAELCNKIGENADEITQGVEALAELDLAFAKAKYADAIRAKEPVLGQRLKVESSKKNLDKASTSNPQSFNLIEARHPLLDQATVVPLNIILDAETRALVITGPNTGGKTVTLKTVGLLALMAQSGLHIPAESGSALPCFKAVHADIGDEQSIEQSLSTFSGHIKNISQILKKADENSLVIFDELGAGTDPQEGAALARAILSELLNRGSLSFVATHYPELKAFAHTTEKVVNASLEFDLHSLRPTYKLTIGLPGRSNALAIARRLGLDPNVLDAAEQEIDPGEMRVDSMLDDIHRQKKIARKDRNKAQKARIEAHRLRRQLDEKLEKIEDERRKILDQARDQAKSQVEAAQAEIQEMKRRLQEAEKPLEEIEEVEEQIKRIEENIPQPIPKKKKLVVKKQEQTISGLPEVGDKVFVKKLGTEGLVTALGDDEVEVQVGALRMWANLKDVQLKKKAVSEKKIIESISSPNVDTPRLELDIRGERAEDALDKLEHYIDQAYIAEMPFVRIVHGKGTGRLREVVREALRANSYVKSFEEGKAQEGGAGVTVVKF
ncbi:MAG: endonuclease MutS2 [Anaerolineae bacterium]|jgi:DNA mismatch repair protein MutS2|nr:endonuclease MutS2 [Anaerolineae bacterium]MBT7075971.1 endonuclease MutS2 [Anaerolineae bacterium]MBT7783814.1 endonuclease MutS2 [Anaerolineae bacterium]